MTVDDFDLDTGDLERRMNGALEALRQEFATLRTGRASAVMVESLSVDAYDTVMPLNQCGTINIPEPRMISVSIWDKTLVPAVSKAIQESGLGINPIVEGTVIRLPIPELNEERRLELSKTAVGQAENARIAIRNIRRDGMEQLKKAKNDGVSEDEIHLWSGEVQDLTDQAIVRVDEALEAKRTEIMAV